MKKILSVVVMLVMVAGMLPNVVFAAENTTEYDLIPYEGMDFSETLIGIGWFGMEFYYTEVDGKLYSYTLLDNGEYALVELTTGEIILKQFEYQGRTYIPNGAIKRGGETYFTVCEGTEPEVFEFYAVRMGCAGIVDKNGDVFLGCDGEISEIYVLSEDVFLMDYPGSNMGYLYNAKTGEKISKTDHANVYDSEVFAKSGTYVQFTSDRKYHYVSPKGVISSIGVSVENNYGLGAPLEDGICLLWQGSIDDTIDGRIKGWIYNNKAYYSDKTASYLGDGIIFTGKIVDKEGNVIIDQEFDDASSVEYGYCRVKKDGKYGIIDIEKGSVVIPVEYDFISDIGVNEFVVCFDVDESRKDYKYGVVDRNNNILIPITDTYDEIDIVSGGYIVKYWPDECYYGLIDKQNNIILPLEYNYIYECDTGVFEAEKDSDYYYFNINGQLVSPPEDEPLEEDNLWWQEAVNQLGIDNTYFVGEGEARLLLVAEIEGKWYRVMPKSDSQEPEITGVTLSNAEYTYDGTEKSVSISGTLPYGATVSYTNEKATDAGTYNVF